MTTESRSKSANTISNNMEQQPFGNQRVVLLDVLRVALALLVFMFHSNMHFQCSYGLLDDFVSVGALAMTGFFLLSGYVLRVRYGGSNLMERNELGRFYLKRLLSILPLYYTIALLYVGFLGKELLVENLILFPVEVMGIQSTFTTLFGVSHNGGTWFVSCLLLGYLVYPFLQNVVKQLPNKCNVVLLLLLIGIELWATIIKRTFQTCSLYANPFYRIVELTIGLLVADVNMTANGKLLNALRSWGMLIVTGTVMLAGVSVVNHVYRVHDYMLLNWIALPCFVIMLFPLGYKKVDWMEKSKLIKHASNISYAFFLSQFFIWPVGVWFVEMTGFDYNWVRILFTFLLCILISVLLYEIVQNRVVGLFKKMIQSKIDL